MIRKLLKKLVYTDWRIAFLDNSLEDVVMGKKLNVLLVDNPYRDRWFADPFILDLSEENIILLVEEVMDSIKVGKICKLTIRRSDLKIIDRELLLDLPTHLSFPVIVRQGDNIFVYPENGASGRLNCYRYDRKTEKLIFHHTIMEGNIADAIQTNLFNDDLIFATKAPMQNGNTLTVFRNENGNYKEYESYVFSDNIARMAGEFFMLGDKVYRPAQENNNGYGHGMVIQEVSRVGMKLCFTEVRRMTSPHPVYDMGFHTLNSYNGLVVVDVKGFRYPLIARSLRYLISIFNNSVL